MCAGLRVHTATSTHTVALAGLGVPRLCTCLPLQVGIFAHGHPCACVCMPYVDVHWHTCEHIHRQFQIPSAETPSQRQGVSQLIPFRLRIQATGEAGGGVRGLPWGDSEEEILSLGREVRLVSACVWGKGHTDL